MKQYRAECLKEIFWNGQTYRRGDPIVIAETDVELLRTAGVIGDIRLQTTEIRLETAVIESPEDASRNYRRRGR